MSLPGPSERKRAKNGHFLLTRPRSSATYYDRPVLKEPVWIWTVPAYFYLGGAAGVAAVLGAAAEVIDESEFRGLIKHCRRIAAAGTLGGSVLLVLDLGRPERFLNMLRVFRPTSVLNMGSWVLASSASASVASVIFGDGRGRALGNAAGAVAGITGLPLTGYTAVLLSDTAVPLWAATRKTMPWLFVASSVSSTASLLEPASLTARERRIVRRLGAMGKAAALVAMAAVERDASSVEEVRAPLKQGLGATLWQTTKVLTAAGLVATVLPGKGRGKRLIGAALGTGAGLALRFAVWQAGKHSARDPRATFAQQRAGVA